MRNRIEVGVITAAITALYALVAWSLGDPLFPWRDRPVERESPLRWNATDAAHVARDRQRVEDWRRGQRIAP